MNQQKSQLRKQIIKQRQELSITQWKLKNEQICQQIENHDLFTRAKAILTYFSFRKEPDLSSLLTKKKAGFPRCVNNSLTWYFWQPPQRLIVNKYKILEPLATSNSVKPSQVNLILVPTVACDSFGYRLGYGGGYYDRFLSSFQWQNIPTMGIVFDFAYMPKLPTEPWDIKLDYICTESFIKAID